MTPIRLRTGTEPLQYADFYSVPGSRRLLVRVHGGSWRSAPLDSDTTARELAQRGLSVLDVNYRGWNRDSDSPGGGEFPHCLDDVCSALRICLDPTWIPPYDRDLWASVRDQIHSQAVTVVGVSAGGHLAVMAVCQVGHEFGVWPDHVLTFYAPLNLGGTDHFIEPLIQHMIDTTVLGGDISLRRSASVTSQVQDTWHHALALSPTGFKFVYNVNDTLVEPRGMTQPGAEMIREVMPPGQVEIVPLVQGHDRGSWPWNQPIVFLGARDQLPDRAELGHAYLVSGEFWVWSELEGRGQWRPWFQHQNTDTESRAILDHLPPEGQPHPAVLATDNRTGLALLLIVLVILLGAYLSQ